MWRLLLLSLCLAGAAEAGTRRFAIVLGNNAGSSDRPPLRFAESDAGKMARVLAELGDVAPDDVFLLQGQRTGELERAFIRVRQRAVAARAAPDTRVVVLFYYSGHADGEALELGTERVLYTRLRSLLSGTGADLKVVVIDACKSGAALAQRGGKPAPAFVIQLRDELTATGEAFITSSAADEAALESEELKGGLFTHSFVSGLRGAADVSGDKQVTLAEVYRHAHDRTLAATALLGTGQHALYDYRLSGQGEFVLASLQRSSSVLELPTGADRALITDLARDQIVAEVQTGSGREIALPSGRYGVNLLRGGDAYGGRYTLNAGTRQLVRWEDLTKLGPLPRLAMRGGQEKRAAPPEVKDAPEPRPAPDSTGGLWLAASFGAGKTVAEELALASQLRMSAETGIGVTFALIGMTGASSVHGLVENGFQARVGYRFLYQFGALALTLGGEAGPAYLAQSQTGGEAISSFAVYAAIRLGARLHLYKPLWLTLEGELPMAILKLDDRLQARALPAATAGLALTF